MKIKSLLIICLGAFFISGFSYVYIYKPDRVIVSSAEFAYDITDKNQVVNSAENVFVGTVSERQDVKEDNVGVYTPFLIKVDENLKGELQLNSEVLVSQRIGYDNKEKATIKLSEKDTYLQVGESYIFSVRYDSTYKVHRIIVPEYGNLKISNLKDKDASKTIINSYKEAAKSIKIK